MNSIPVRTPYKFQNTLHIPTISSGPSLKMHLKTQIQPARIFGARNTEHIHDILRGASLKRKRSDFRNPCTWQLSLYKRCRIMSFEKSLRLTALFCSKRSIHVHKPHCLIQHVHVIHRISILLFRRCAELVFVQLWHTLAIYEKTPLSPADMNTAVHTRVHN